MFINLPFVLALTWAFPNANGDLTEQQELSTKTQTTFSIKQNASLCQMDIKNACGCSATVTMGQNRCSGATPTEHPDFKGSCPGDLQLTLVGDNIQAFYSTEHCTVGCTLGRGDGSSC
ncbi:hypothetical protein F5B20DRAFT_541948 [Whalleya microplaca]|nr:hypothetical protein F5B20DRAFT_541948 [Whalleya microplaca]